MKKTSVKGPDGTVYDVEKVMEISRVNRECAKARIRKMKKTGLDIDKLLAPLNKYKNRKGDGYKFKHVREELTDEQKRTLSEMSMDRREIELLDKHFPLPK